jgi:hypothetical protein
MKNAAFLILLLSLAACKKDATPSTTDKTLVAYYTFTGNCTDQSDYANNGTVVGATLTTDSLGKANAAYSFDGNSYILIPNKDVLNIKTNKLTLSAWIKPSTLGSQYVIHKSTDLDGFGEPGGGGGPFSLDFFTGQTRAMLFDSLSNVTEIDGTTTIKANVWQHLALTWDGSVARVYYNGQLEGSKAFVGPLLVTTGNVYLGAYKWVFPSSTFKGIMDNVRIYNRALSTAEIQDLYNNFK